MNSDLRINGVEIKSPPGNGPYRSRIHGQIYHLVSPLYPNEAKKPGYGELYIFDSAEATATTTPTNGLNTKQTKGIWQKYCTTWTRSRDKVAYFLSI
jgi:hypothetical protein